MRLDVGSGGGKYTSDPYGDVCTDISIPKVGQIPNVFVRCDAHLLPFKDDAFEVSIAYNVLEHVRDPGRVLLELLRVAPMVQVRQDQLWSIGAIAETEHLWIQLPGLRFVPFPRTSFGICFGNLVMTVIQSRPLKYLWRAKYKKRFANTLLFPHRYYTIRR